MTLFRLFQQKKRAKQLVNDVLGKGIPQVPDFRDAPHYKGDLRQALEYFESSLGLSDDFIVRMIKVAGRTAACVFISTICDHKAIEETIRELHQHQYPNKIPKEFMQYLIENVLPSSDSVFMTNLFELKESIGSGDLVLLVDGMPPAVVMGAKIVEHRIPEQPVVESAVRGSQISFVESLDMNIGLIRTNLNTDTLHIKKLKIGYRSRKEIAVAYLVDVANSLAVETVLKRLSAIHIDVISQSAGVEQRIIDHKWAPFPLTRVTQRIDSTVREMNQGKISILVDGDPNTILVPATWQDFFQTEEDYTHSFYEATFIRWLRVIAFFLAAYLPALYIAFVDFNPELLPKTLGIQIAQSREGVPFPAIVEVLIMQTVVEILREATLRMPKQMGQTLGIVGGLVVGEASVQAGLVSNILIIVIALTAVSIFVTPSYEFATVLRIGSWLMFGCAAILGLYGIILATIWMLYEVSALKSFGISYLDPFGGDHIRDVFTDAFVRLPVTVMDKRASHLHTKDDVGERGYRNPLPHPLLEKASRNTKPGKNRRKQRK